MAGAGEDEATHAAVGIDHALKGGKELGGALDFIEDGSICDLAQEGARVSGGEASGIGIFKSVDVKSVAQVGPRSPFNLGLIYGDRFRRRL